MNTGQPTIPIGKFIDLVVANNHRSCIKWPRLSRCLTAVLTIAIISSVPILQEQRCRTVKGASGGHGDIEHPSLSPVITIARRSSISRRPCSNPWSSGLLGRRLALDVDSPRTWPGVFHLRHQAGFAKFVLNRALG